MYDFTFLAPCPSSGLVLTGEKDEIVPYDSVKKLVDKLNQQRDINVVHEVVPGANHFFQSKLEEMDDSVTNYMDARAAGPASR
jgi:alpha/beta superfamily hydrolase